MRLLPFPLLLATASLLAAKPTPLFQSPVVTTGTPGHAVEIDVQLPANARALHLVVTDGGDGHSFDWADWVAPRIVMADGSEKPLTSLDWTKAVAGWGQVREQRNAGGGELRVNGAAVKDGIGTHANSVISYSLPAGAKRFRTRGGLDDGGTSQAGEPSVQFLVYTNDPPTFIAPQATGGGSAPHEASEAVGQLVVHPGLEATLFASEPMMVSPSSIDIDHRGRVWVCEVVNYRGNRGKRPEGDRILIIEDTDGDNVADRSTVFHQGADIDSAHGICVLGNRALVSAGDEIFWLIDDDGDDRSDRKEMLFTRIGGKQHDHGIHAVHFGPDGKLYFNFGNAGRQLCDKDGKLITDLAGNEVRGNNAPYRQGMIFRCDLDGSNVETLAWNFRNNWEVCVDSFGRLWQSDNDDDGNRGVRINYVLPYGNYGYCDEITGAGWRDPRPGMEEEIPLRHWHLNDPGVVPNLLQTGAGSPTGICVYEGDLLPKEFHGQLIHCDAGPNIVRAYPVTPDGAGFTADTINILDGTANRWFRPSDVCVAPDGSLIVADWYDPGVGGHGMRDIERGRLFLVAPEGHRYSAPELDLESPAGILAALDSPNMATRYLAYTAAKAMPSARITPVLQKRFDDHSAPAHLRARAFWALMHHAPDRDVHLTSALSDRSSAIRVCGVHACGIAVPRADDDNLLGFAFGPDPQMAAVAATAMRFSESPHCDANWAKLAATYKGNDRWLLEALGIGADLHWPSRFAAYMAETNNNPHPDIVWRARCEAALPFLEKAILDAGDPVSENRLVRALHFHPKSPAREVVARNLFLKGSTSLATLIALHELDRGTIERSGGLPRLEELVLARKDDPALVQLATRFQLDSAPVRAALLEFIVARRDDPQSANAARHLLGDSDFLARALSSDRTRPALVAALGRSGDNRAVAHLTTSLEEAKDTGMRRSCVEALALSRPGENQLLELARNGTLPDDVKFTAAALLGRSGDAKIRDQITKALDLPPAPGTADLPPLADLLRMRGNPQRGAAAFEKATCATCHQARGKGINFGPDLSEIGNKLSAEGLYEAILYPSNAIAHGYAGVSITTHANDALAGFISSETDEKVTLSMAGGLTRDLAHKDIRTRVELGQSLMPAGLAGLLTPQELADLVAYLRSLQK